MLEETRPPARKLLVVFGALPFLVAYASLGASETPNLHYQVAERGADYKVMQSVRSLTNSAGQITSVTNRYTVLGNGMNRKDAGSNWVECMPVVQSFPGGIVCTGATYRVILKTNLNRQGSVDFELDNGQRIISHPLALAYFDPESGRREYVARINDCRAEVVSNRVVYAGAITNGGFDAAIVYTYGVGRFHQDVVFTKQPAVTPADLGMGEKARLEMVTEIMQAPIPTKKTRVLRAEKNVVARSRMAEPDLRDETLIFTERMQMPLGYAALNTLSRTNDRAAIPVSKQLRTMADGRMVLIEAMEWLRVREQLDRLPKRYAGLTSPAKERVFAAVLPERPLADGENGMFDARLKETSQSGPVELVAVMRTPPQGFILDYVIVDGSQMTLTPGTYFIPGPVYFSNLRYASDVVVKFSTGGNCQMTVDSWNVDSVGYYELGGGNPVVFTSMEDDSVGEIIDGSSGHTGMIENAGVVFGAGEFRLGGICRYLDAALTFQPPASAVLYNWKFENCRIGLLLREYGDLFLDGGSFVNCGAALYQYTGSSAVFRNVFFGCQDSNSYGYIFCGVNQSTTDTNSFSCSLNPFAAVAGGTLTAMAGYSEDVYNSYYGPSTLSSVSLHWNSATTSWSEWDSHGQPVLLETSVNSLGLAGQSVTNLTVSYLGGMMSLISATGLPVDSDCDGLPDAWEIQYFGNIYQLGRDDSDGDGHTNLQEYLAGKNPTNPASNPGDGDSDCDGLIDTWELAHFGNLLQTSGGDYDSDGLSNLAELNDGSDPNTVGFLVSFPDIYITSATPSGVAKVCRGRPAWRVMLVDIDPQTLSSAQINDLGWQSCPSGTQSGSVLSVTPSLATDGWHTVWVGMKGLSADSKVTWNSVRIKRDTTAPVIHLVSPAMATSTVPYRRLQVKAYCDEPLSRIAYDLASPDQTVTGISGFVTSQTETRSDFKLFDVYLTTGSDPNTLTIHAWDLAGNQTTTTLTLNVDSQTPPPVDSGISWPGDGVTIAGSTFTVVGNVSDPSSAVVATITDSFGNTTTVAGLVDGNGNYTIENLPLAEGESTLSVTVTDGLGRSVTTTRSVRKSAYVVNLDANYMERLKPSIGGSITKVGNPLPPDIASVSINGHSFVLDETTGQSIPYTSLTMGKNDATLPVTVILTPVTGPVVELHQLFLKPASVCIESYSEHISSLSAAASGDYEGWTYDLGSWSDAAAAAGTASFTSGSYSHSTDFTFPPNRFLNSDCWQENDVPAGAGALPRRTGIPGQVSVVAQPPNAPITYTTVPGGEPPDAVPNIVAAYRDIELHWQGNGWESWASIESQFKLVLETGGRPGEWIPFQLDLGLATVEGGWHWWSPQICYKPTHIYIPLPASPAGIRLGSFGKTDANGRLWTMLPSASRLEITPALEGLTQITASDPETGKQFSWGAASVTPTYAFNVTIDSNNNGAIEPDGDDDRIEDIGSGQVLMVNNGDEDHDGTPNWADFHIDAPNKSFGALGTMRMRFPGSQCGQLRIRFKYLGSDPDAINFSANPLAPPEGAMRLWKSSGSPNTRLRQAAPSGDYVKPDQAYSLADLGYPGPYPAGVFEIELRTEIVRASSKQGDIHITGEMDPDGTGSFFDFCQQDGVRMTGVGVDILMAPNVFVNSDDDNADGVIDMDDGIEVAGIELGTKTIQGENDLVPVVLRADGCLPNDKITLEVSGGIAIWKTAQRGPDDPVISPGNISATFQGSQMPVTLYVEGITPSSEFEGLELSLTGPHYKRSVTKTVFDVTSTIWESVSDDNPVFDPIGENAGKGIYADKPAPTSSGDFTAVCVRVQISPPDVADIPVNLAMFDVDDPSANRAPVDDETRLGDNRGGGAQLEETYVTTDEFGEAETIFHVTKQPGDNFRVLASPLGDFSECWFAPQERDDGAVVLKTARTWEPLEDRWLEVPVEYSTPMLTVWRRLHIERDSMRAGTLNERTVTGLILGILPTTGTPSRAVVNVDFTQLSSGADESVNLSTVPPSGFTYRGRFELGNIWIGPDSSPLIPGPVTSVPVTGNGDSYVDAGVASPFSLPFRVYKEIIPGFPTQVSGTFDMFDKISGTCRFITTTPLSPHTWDGEEIIIAGEEYTVEQNYSLSNNPITGAAGTCYVVEVSCAGIPFRLWDDDSNLLPKLPDVGSLNAYLNHAYVVPITDTPGVQDGNLNVPFILNVEEDNAQIVAAQDWDSKALNSDDFWVAYLLSAFQGPVLHDADPNAAPENEVLLGMGSKTHGGALIFLESIRDSNSYFDEAHTVVHEIGHLLGLLEGHPVAERFDSNLPMPSWVPRVDYTPEYINGMRNAPHPRP